MKLNEYNESRAVRSAGNDIEEGLMSMYCPCGAPVHLVIYAGCKPDVPVYYCEYGELHEGKDPYPCKETLRC